MTKDWTVNFTKRAEKQLDKLSKSAFAALRLLVRDLESKGPAPGKEWQNYGKLRGLKRDCRHCHLIKGNPTYVCCWEVVDRKIRIIEVYYAGTHEKAPY
jgi:mRNA-degrading endonuclease RelE of RelBE toxin-antitoxin system